MPDGRKASATTNAVNRLEGNAPKEAPREGRDAEFQPF